jgi:hypothetical protein
MVVVRGAKSSEENFDYGRGEYAYLDLFQIVSGQET